MTFYKPFKQVVFVSLAFLFLGCEDKSYFTQTYDEKLLKQKTTCLKLTLTPYSNEVFQKVKNLYPFNENCTRILEIKYKSKIACNSPYNTNKSFNSFIELNLLDQDKLIYTVYKDLKNNDDIIKEIEKGYDFLWKQTNH
jgi:hypothetical protein